MKHPLISSACVLVQLLCLSSHAREDNALPQDLFDMDFADLANQEIYSLSKMPQRLFDSAAAVFVITQEDLRRSGVTNIAEALGMVPGVSLARVDASKWAVSARGFNSRFANKMLVLVDGRAIYTPIFSGTFWEAFELPLTSIERLEVIRGPGASVWGANAVNGVINIITKTSQDTRGGLLGVTVGDEARRILDLRYGGSLADNVHFRAYAKYLNRDALLDRSRQDSRDDWQLGRVGFRVDGAVTRRDTLMLQGDIYSSRLHQNFTLPSVTSPTGSVLTLDDGRFSGGWLLGRWEQTQSPSSRTTLQISYQEEERDDELADYRLDTFSASFTNELALADIHELTWGVDSRFHADQFNETPLLSMARSDDDYNLFSAFMQDRIDVFAGRGEVTVGAKFEYTSWTGWEIQPTLRFLWEASATERIWMAVSRAARTPSRVERNGTLRPTGLPPGSFEGLSPLPGVITFVGDPDMGSEELRTYEIGYRASPRDTIYFDVTGFYNEYDDLRTAEPLDVRDISLGSDVVYWPTALVNGEEARTYGLELSVDWRPKNYVRFQLGYSFLEAAYRADAAPEDPFTFAVNLGDERDPKHQVDLRSSFNVLQNLELDVWLRYVDAIEDVFIPAPPWRVAVDDYFTADVRIGWRPYPGLSLSLVGRNLLDAPRVEIAQEASTFLTQIEPSYYLQAELSF